MKTITVIILAATLAIPSGLATWSSNGAYEPNNALDVPTLIWNDAPGSVTDRIYFNAFTVESSGLVSIYGRMNVATLETRNGGYGRESYAAILGNWVDCNRDGYIGLAESALREYDAMLLFDDSLCPAHIGPTNEWDGSHNYNGWVSELIPVGTDGGQPSVSTASTPDTEDNHLDIRIIRDTGARIWADRGRPSDPAPASAGSCPINPLPKGTLQSSGGALNYVDCFSGATGLINRAFGDQLTLLPETPPGPITIPLLGDPLGLRFHDVNDSRSGPLGQVGTFGSEDSSHAAVGLADCSAEPLFDSGATFNATNEGAGRPVDEGDQSLIWNTTGIKVQPVSPSLRNTADPTVAGQVNQTSEEFDGDCDTTNDNGGDVYGIAEGDHEPVKNTDKRSSDLNFEFEDSGVLSNMGRGGACSGILAQPDDPCVAFPEQFHSGPSGATVNNELVTYEWFSRSSSVGVTPNTVRTRGSVTAADATVEGNQGRFITYYAYVSSTTTSSYRLPGPNAGQPYGAAQCGSATTGIVNGWNCDASLWNRNAADGSLQPSTQGGLGRPGLTYNMRDVDCDDGQNNLGVPVGTATFNSNACA